MGWPKGKPRKGHVNKDGKKHAERGERLRAIRENPERYKAIRAEPKVDRIQKAVAVVYPAIATASVVIKGATGRPVIEPCPTCGFAYADGGYCEECGWTVWVPRERVRVRT